MKLIRKTKKGFTLVELIVVIAIVAILAAVSVVSYIAFINQANLSADQQMVTQMNRILQADRILNEYTYAGDAVQALYRNGFNNGKMEAYSSGFHYAYSLDTNKMYLLDNNDDVIYPEDTNKSTLWGFYRDAVEGRLEGVTQYIALANVLNQSNLEALIDTTAHKIDLNGYYFGVDGTYDNLSVVNGIIVKGNVAEEEGTKQYEQHEGSTVAKDTEYSEVVFNNITDQAGKGGLVFKDCVLYNTTIRITGTSTFENCLFIDANGSSAALDIYTSTSANDENTVITIKNCTFTNVARPISIAGHGQTSSEAVAVDNTNKIKERTVIIDGCTFNGTVNEKYAAFQLAEAFKTNVEFKNNTIYSLGSAVTIVRFHEAYNFKNQDWKYNGHSGFDTANLVRVSFSNNKVSKSISSTKYVDVDEKDFPEFLSTATNKFSASVSTF